MKEGGASSNDLELKLRIIKGEIRESKREKEKSSGAVFGVIGCLVSLIIGSFYFFIVKKEGGIMQIILSVVLLLLILILGPYWYNRYKIACKKIEQLEKELARLKKEADSNTRLK